MRAQEREEFMQKSRKAHPFEMRLRLLEEAHEQMKQKMDETDGEGLEQRVSDLESNYEDLDSRHEELYSRHEELSEKVEDLEGQLADADSRIDDLESEVW
jgi:predicted nuclease with TOPRIM domain